MFWWKPPIPLLHSKYPPFMTRVTPLPSPKQEVSSQVDSPCLGIISYLDQESEKESENGDDEWDMKYSSNHVCKTMSAGLAVVWQVSILNKFCWIWSSGVVINTLKFSWLKRTCDVSKVFSQIKSLQVDIKSLKYRKESFWSIIRSWSK